MLERSVEALGWFGDRSALDTLGWVRENVRDANDRTRTKVRHVLDEPDFYLAGPPRDVPEK